MERLRRKGHEIVAAAPSSAVNALTGEGVARRGRRNQVVVDLANSPSFEEKAVLEFFETAGRNLLAAEAKAGVKHHVALSTSAPSVSGRRGFFSGQARPRRD